MAWRRASEPAHVEPPGWYRVFDPAAWDAPDAHELGMIAGNLGQAWPDELHRIHARRRWGEAKHAYRQEHPLLAEQEFTALVAAERQAREQEKPA